LSSPFQTASGEIGSSICEESRREGVLPDSRTAAAPEAAIQKRALEEGLPYQTLISSLLHKYAAGRLKEV
jgi:hypothetical protein